MLRFFPTASRTILYFLAVILFLFTGCEAPKIPDDTAIVLIEMWPQTLDPLKATNAVSQKIDNLIHGSLVRLTPDMKITGDLAERWSIKGYRKFQITLKSGLKFQDGSPLTSADVINSIQEFRRSAVHGTVFKPIARIWSNGPLDVQFETTAPQPFLLNDFPLLKIFKRASSGEVIGAGRFKVVRIGAQEIELAIADTYFEPVPQKGLHKIVFRFVGDNMTLYQLLVRGDGNVALSSLSLTKTQYLRDHLPKGMLVKDDPGVNYSYLCFNFRDPRLKNLRVRQAIAYAIDVESILKYKLGGFSYRASGILAPAHREYYEPNVTHYEFDRGKAERLLDEAGYPRVGPNGWRFQLFFKTTTEKFGNEMAKLIAGELRAVGIDVRLDVVEAGTFFADLKAKNFQIFHSRWVGVNNPSIYLRAFHSKEHGSFNRGSYFNPEMDRLTEAGATEINDLKRREIFSKIQKLASQDLPYISLWHWNNTFFGTSRMQNIVMYPNGDYRTLQDLRLGDSR